MTAAIESAVNEAARRYARRVWWANTDDLKQEGWIAALEATQSWNPNGGASLRWYVWTAIVRSMRNHLLRESAPVKAGWHNLHKLKGLKRIAVPEDNDLSTRPGNTMVCSTKLAAFTDPRLTPEEALAVEEWATRSRKVVEKTVFAGKLPTKVMAVLIDGTKVRKLTRTERARRQLLRACKTAKDAVRDDLVAQDLWESR